MSDAIQGGAPAPAAAPAQSATPTPSPAPAAAPAAGAAPTPAEIRKFKVKIDGAEREVEESELVARYQKEATAEKRFEEAAKIRKQAEAVVRALHEGQGHELLMRLPPEVRAKTIKALLATGDEYVTRTVEDHVVEQLKYERMTPEQREVYDTRRENERFKAEREAQAKAQQEAQAKQARAQYEQMFEPALNEVQVKPTKLAKARLAYYVSQAMNNPQLGWTMRQCAGFVAEEMRELGPPPDAVEKSKLSSMTPEQIEEFLGEELLTKLREHQVAKLKPKVPAAATPPRGQDGKFKRKEEPRRKTIDEVRAEWELERINGRR